MEHHETKIIDLFSAAASLTFHTFFRLFGYSNPCLTMTNMVLVAISLVVDAALRLRAGSIIKKIFNSDSSASFGVSKCSYIRCECSGNVDIISQAFGCCAFRSWQCLWNLFSPALKLAASALRSIVGTMVIHLSDTCASRTIIYSGSIIALTLNYYVNLLLRNPVPLNQYLLLIRNAGPVGK